MDDQKSDYEEKKGIIGRFYENDFPVIVSFINELPTTEIKDKFQTLVVISWSYNGVGNNGMPFKKENDRMILLEDLIMGADALEKTFVNAYNRTGNNLKEFIFYCETQKEFMKMLNVLLKNYERFPIEIKFYQDKEWSEFNRLLKDFNK